MWGCEDVKMWRCEDVKMWMWRCEDVQMWGYEDVKMWRCEDVRMWRCEDVMMWGREDVKMWGCEVVKMWRCDDVKMWKYADPTFRRTLRSDALGKNKAGWWFGCHQFYCPIHIGIMSSSQLTNSYFSEGWLKTTNQKVYRGIRWSFFTVYPARVERMEKFRLSHRNTQQSLHFRLGVSFKKPAFFGVPPLMKTPRNHVSTIYSPYIHHIVFHIVYHISYHMSYHISYHISTMYQPYINPPFMKTARWVCSQARWHVRGGDHQRASLQFQAANTSGVDVPAMAGRWSIQNGDLTWFNMIQSSEIGFEWLSQL